MSVAAGIAWPTAIAAGFVASVRKDEPLTVGPKGERRAYGPCSGPLRRKGERRLAGSLDSCGDARSLAQTTVD